MAVPPGSVGKNFYNSVVLGVVSWGIFGLLAD